MLLLAAGADVNARDESCRTAAHIAAAAAVENGFEIDAKLILNALLVEGADLDAADRNGITVRHFFANRDDVLSAADEQVARRALAKVRLEFVRDRALQVCIGLRSRQLDAFTREFKVLVGTTNERHSGQPTMMPMRAFKHKTCLDMRKFVKRLLHRLLTR
jgi:hypothetical protein